MAVQQFTDGEPYFRGSQLIRSYLVKQRLESMVVILVDNCDPDVGITQFLDRADASESGA
jgi:enterochelin esterase-like enzyme